MTRVMTGDVGMVCQVRADANSHRFFAGIQVHEAGNFPGSKLRASPLFKFADGLHLLVHAKQLRLIQRLRTDTTTLFGYHSCKPPNCRDTCERYPPDVRQLANDAGALQVLPLPMQL